MNLKELKKLQKEYVLARDNQLNNEDEYNYLDNKILELQCVIDSYKTLDSEDVGIISVVCLMASMFTGILAIFRYEFFFVCLITFIAGIIIGIYAMILKNK